MKFQATHIIINEDHAGEPIPIMLCQSPADNGGPAYTEAEWNSESTADYERDEDGAWLFQGKVFNGTVKAVTMNISTHIGFKEYHGSDTLYDGQFEPTLEGTVEEVIAHLESFLHLDSPEFESLKWEGPNGWFYQGEEAGKMLRAEIASLRDGSHSCFDVEE